MGISKKNILLFLTGIAAAALLFSLYLVLSPPKNYIIGYVNPNPTEFEGAQGFLRNLPKFGYVEGENTTIIRCETKDKTEIEAAIRDMVARKVDLVFTMTTPATEMAKEISRGTGIPVVFILYDAVKSGVVENLLTHNGNLTGIQLRGSTPKALEKMLEIAPDAKHILTPICFDTGAANRSLEDLKTATEELGLKLTVSEVKTLEQLHTSMQDIPEDVDAVFILHTWLVGTNLGPVLAAATKRNIPVFSAGHVHYDNGLLFSYGPRDEETGTQAARLVHNILFHGVPPGELPVETSDFFLGINLKTAEFAGLEIPYHFLQQADFIER